MEKTKKVYIKPVLESENFVPQSYVAACNEEKKEYKFVCDAKASGWSEFGGVYQETNGKPGLQILSANPDKMLSFLSYHPCSETHYAPTDDEFIHGYLVGVGLPVPVEEVIIWTANGTNVHCTTNLNMNSWITVKS